MRVESLIVVTSGVLISMSAFSAARRAEKKVRIPPVPKGHPRVYVRPADLPTVRRKAQLREFAQSWRLVRESRRNVCQAFVYLMTGDRKIGRQAVEGGFARLAGYSGRRGKKVKDGRPFYNYMHKAACIYDWCYDLLTDQEKKDFIREFKKFAAEDHNRGYPPKGGNPIVGHDCEGWIMSNLLPAGLAVHDEDPEMYELAARLFFTSFVEPCNFYYRSHMHHQGTNYNGERFVHDQATSWLFCRIGAGDVLSREQQFVPYQLLYALRPDGMFLKSGDENDDTGTYLHKYLAARLSGAYYNDPYLLTFSECKRFSTWQRDFYSIFDLLFLEPNAKRAPLDELPLTKYFGSPMGDMVARTGWSLDVAGRDAVVHMRIGEHCFSNHHHRDFGTFQIYYRGPLAIDTGVYQASDDSRYGSPHWRYYYTHTLAHNGLMIFDPATAKLDFGGQRRPKRAPRGLHELKRELRWAEVTAHAFGPDPRVPAYSYLAGDITRAYHSGKVSRVERSMVTFNTRNPAYPCVFVVFDRVVSTKPGFKKVWYLHSIQEPVVDGRATTIVRDGKAYHGGEYGGQLAVETLLPERARIEKVGGPGRECWNEVTQTNYMVQLGGKGSQGHEIGAWRIEVVPTRAAKQDFFLNVLTVMDKGAPKPAATMLRGDRLVGARAAGHAVFFNQTTRLLEQTSFKIAGNRQVHVLVCGLAPGTWAVSGPTRTKAIRVTADAKCLYVRGVAGRYELKRRGLLAASRMDPNAPQIQFYHRCTR